MKTFFKVALLSTSIFLSVSHASEPLEAAMKVLATNTKLFSKSSTSEDALVALDEMKKAVLIAKENKPKKLKKLEETDAKVVAYEDKLKELSSAIENAEQLVQEGKLDEAKKLSDQFNKIKKQGHRAFRF